MLRIAFNKQKQLSQQQKVLELENDLNERYLTRNERELLQQLRHEKKLAHLLVTLQVGEQHQVRVPKVIGKRTDVKTLHKLQRKEVVLAQQQDRDRILASIHLNTLVVRRS